MLNQAKGVARDDDEILRNPATSEVTRGPGKLVARVGGLRVPGVSGRHFDRGVILRAHRFVAELAGFRLERGHYMDQEDDRADRWYVVPLSEETPSRSGSGFKTSAAAAAEAKRLAAEAAEEAETDDTE